MSAAAPFTWHESRGWIVLSGAPDALSEVRAQALSRCDGAGAIAYVSLAADRGDALMDDMAELGAPSGYLVDLEASDNNEIYERLSGASMIVIEGEGAGDDLRARMTQTVFSALKSALERGALLLLEGGAAAMAGERRLTEAGGIGAGLNLAQKVVILARSDGSGETDSARRIQRELPAAAVIGLARGSALALGPAGQIETWGDGDVRISLGQLSSQPPIGNTAGATSQVGRMTDLN